MMENSKWGTYLQEYLILRNSNKYRRHNSTKILKIYLVWLYLKIFYDNNLQTPTLINMRQPLGTAC